MSSSRRGYAASISEWRDPHATPPLTWSLDGFFASDLMQRSVPWYGAYQRDYLRLIETDPDVSEFVDRPFRAVFRVADVMITWIPDFLITRGGEQRLVDLNRRRHSDDPLSFIPVELDKVAAELGYGFERPRLPGLKRQPRFRNAELLLAVRQHKVPLDVSRWLRDRAITRPGTIGELLADCPVPITDYDILKLCLARVLTVDLDVPVGEDSLVTLGARP